MIIELRPGKSKNFRDFEAYSERLERLHKIAEYLREIAGTVERDECECNPHGIVLGLLNKESPEILWTGLKAYSEAREVALRINDHCNEREYGSLPSDSVKKAREWKRQREIEYQVYIDNHPWVCERGICSRRFKTKRGAERHEAVCMWNKTLSVGAQ